MATAPAVKTPAPFLHVRGSWSARDDRAASMVWLGILWVGMFAGFGVDFHRYLNENPAAPRGGHVCRVAFVFLATVENADAKLGCPGRGTSDHLRARFCCPAACSALCASCLNVAFNSVGLLTTIFFPVLSSSAANISRRSRPQRKRVPPLYGSIMIRHGANMC